MEELKKEYEMKLDEYARLLDLRQARIKVRLDLGPEIDYNVRIYQESKAGIEKSVLMITTGFDKQNFST